MAIKETPSPLPSSAEVEAQLRLDIQNAQLSPEAATPGDTQQVDDAMMKATLAYEAADQSLTKLNKANEAFLAGKIPDEVAQQLKQRAAEQGAMQGFGTGSMIGRKTLRDFGISSLSMMQQGIQQQAMITEQQRAVGEGYRSIAGTKEAVREFNASFAQQAEQLLDATRKTNLLGTSTGLEFAQFRANLTNQVNQQIVALTNTREDLLYRYTAGGMRGEFADTGKTLDNIITQLEQVLGG